MPKKKVKLDIAPLNGAMLSKLSKPAQKLYERVRRGRWYGCTNPPKCMQELVDAKLVTITGRIKVVELSYVMKGYRYTERKPWFL